MRGCGYWDNWFCALKGLVLSCVLSKVVIVLFGFVIIWFITSWYVILVNLRSFGMYFFSLKSYYMYFIY